MKRPPLPYLLLLPLLAVLVFGNCNGGVRGFLANMGSARRERLQNIVARQQAERRTARSQLRGRQRREAYWRIEQHTNARLDSLLTGTFDQRKLQHRRNKIERVLHQLPGQAAAQ